MLARLMNLDELACVVKSMEDVQVLRVFLHQESMDHIPQLG